MAHLLLSILDQKEGIEELKFCISDIQNWLFKKSFRSVDTNSIKRVLQDEWNLEPAANSNACLQYRLETDGAIH